MTQHHPAILVGDCRAVLADLPAESIDAVVTDPPYGLEFMGKEWDSFRLDDPGTSRHRGDNAAGDAWLQDGNDTLPAAGRVVYGAGARPKTSRCTGCGKRDQFRNEHPCQPGAEWKPELIDPHCAPPTSLAFGEWVRTWGAELYRVLKPGAHVFAFGGTRTWHRLAAGLEDAGFDVRDNLSWIYGTGFPKNMNITKKLRADQHPDADAWEGWGTHLKPAHEPIVVARKPPRGTILAAVLEHGTGALHLDACRVPHELGPTDAEWGSTQHQMPGRAGFTMGDGWDGTPSERNDAGRWPTNVLIGHAATCAETCAPSCPVPALREQAGDVAGIFPTFDWDPAIDDLFRYVAKPNDAERAAGLPHGDQNDHPTVKPVDLMRWLVRLATPPGGTVLDPFLGSGTTAVAATLEGFSWLGVEQDPSGRYQQIATDRIRWATDAVSRGRYTPPKRTKVDPDSPQRPLF